MQNLTQPIDFSNWKERASSSGKLNTNPAGKTPMDKYIACLKEISELEVKDNLIASQKSKLQTLKSELLELNSKKYDIVLSQTVKSHLHEVYWRERTGTKKDIHSGYLENGKLSEDDAIKLLSQLDDPELFEMGSYRYEKCTLPRQFNDHFQGECDIHYEPTIQDTKVCWDIDTYYPHINELLFSKEIGEDGMPKSRWNWDGTSWVIDSSNIENNDYECQGIVYMELYGMSEFWLRYCLVNMDQGLIDQQVKSIIWEYAGHSDEANLAIEEFKKKHNFDNLPINLRVTTFKIKRDNAKYLDLCRRVEKSREYLNWYSKEMFYLENPGMRPVQISFFSEKLIPKEENPITLSETAQAIEDPIISVGSVLITETIIELVETKSIEEDEIEAFEGGYPIEIDGMDKSSAQTIIDAENTAFPEVLDTIPDPKPVESPYKTVDESGALDVFKDKIMQLKSVEECTEFYMENADLIDDTEYEPILAAHRESLFPKPEAPKVSKPKAPAEPVAAPINYPNTYTISDGINPISPELAFEHAKKFVMDRTILELEKYTERTQLRDGITSFYLANKPLIDRFKTEFETITKKKYDELIEKQRKEIEEMVNKM